MHYDPRKGDHGLPHDPFMALVVPRPIGWITSVSGSGLVNIGPYSFFNALRSRPPVVMFSGTARKHSQINAEETGDFVVNLASFALREQMNESSAAYASEISEADALGIDLEPSLSVKAPRIRAAPAALECVYSETVELKSGPTIVVGEVVRIYIEDSIIVDGKVHTPSMRPIARLGYMEYAVINETFKMERPK